MWFFGKKKKEPETQNVPQPHSAGVLDSVEKVTRAQKEIMQPYLDGGSNLAKSNEENYIGTSELVFSCIDYVSKAASQATPLLYRKDPKTGERKPVKDKKLQAWVTMPNPFWTWGDLIELSVQGILLSGGAFLTHEMVKGNYETWFLGPPSKVDIVPDKTKYIKGYMYDKKIAYKPEEVCYVKNPTLNNAYYGMPAVRPLFDTLSMEAYATDELQTFYKGSTILTGILKSEVPLTTDQIEELRTQFNQLYSSKGPFKRGTAVLPPRMDFKSVQASPKDAMLIESMNLTEQRVLRVFKLNTLVLGGESSSTTHPQELMKTVFNTAVRPYLYKIAAQVSLFLQRKFKDPTIVFEFDFDKIVELETSLDTKSASAKTLYATGVSSLNEARDLVGLPKLDSPAADKNVLASYLFGNDFHYIQDIGDGTDIGGGNTQGDAQSTPQEPQGDAGSTSPDGGAPDTAAADDTTKPPPKE